ncbi:hypothetical protein ANCCAN_25006 [Ancylostoma caninum]|uniref:Uncharacterized protein n=1 Tax=Ancylostoma caninum TaxID=29170 RepID=A0A368FE08_ANCCA|nr:hypothetical protein ANCCAN_25006 [Ancylostoma caninum]
MKAKISLSYIFLSGFNELVKLVKQGKYSILMDSKSLTRTEMIASSQLPVYQDLWYEIGVNRRIKYVKGIRNAVNFLLQNPAYVLLGPKTVLKMYEQTDCRLTLLQETILPTYVSIPLAKDSPYSTFFSNRFVYLGTKDEHSIKVDSRT